jgi:hypothetical protein
VSKIRIDPLCATVRFYLEEIDSRQPICDMTEPYYKTITVVFMDNGECRLTDCVEAPTLREQRKLSKKLASMGVKKVCWRHGEQEHCLML